MCECRVPGDAMCMMMPCAQGSARVHGASMTQCAGAAWCPRWRGAEAGCGCSVAGVRRGAGAGARRPLRTLHAAMAARGVPSCVHVCVGSFCVSRPHCCAVHCVAFTSAWLRCVVRGVLCACCEPCAVRFVCQYLAIALCVVWVVCLGCRYLTNGRCSFHVGLCCPGTIKHAYCSVVVLCAANRGTLCFSYVPRWFRMGDYRGYALSVVRLSVSALISVCKRKRFAFRRRREGDYRG